MDNKPSKKRVKTTKLEFTENLIFKLQARDIKHTKTAQDRKMTTGQALEFMAHEYGFQDWNTASASLVSHSGSASTYDNGGVVQNFMAIDLNELDDVSFREEFQDDLESILSDLSEVRPWTQKLHRNPFVTVWDKVYTLLKAEGCGWLVFMHCPDSEYSKGRWVFVPASLSVLRFAAHEMAIDDSIWEEIQDEEEEAEQNPQSPKTLSKRMQEIEKTFGLPDPAMVLRYPETEGKSVPEMVLTDPRTRLRLLQARHAECPGFPNDVTTGPGNPIVQEARQNDRLEAAALQGQIDLQEKGRALFLNDLQNQPEKKSPRSASRRASADSR